MAIRTEQETTITFNDEEGEALVWSASPVFQRRMERLGVIAHQRDSREDGESCWYKVPKKWIKVRLPTQLTAEQRIKMAERLRARTGRDRASEPLATGTN